MDMLPALDEIYAYVRQRLAEEEPALMQVATTRPELQVQVKRQTIVVDGASLKGRIALMMASGVFDEPINGNQVFKDLKERQRAKVAKPNVYRTLDELARMGF